MGIDSLDFRAAHKARLEWGLGPEPLDFPDQGRNDLFIAQNHTVLGELEDRSVRVLIDRHDHARIGAAHHQSKIAIFE